MANENQTEKISLDELLGADEGATTETPEVTTVTAEATPEKEVVEEKQESNVVTPNMTSGNDVKAGDAVDIQDIAKFKEVVSGNEEFARKEEELIDENIERVKGELTAIMKPLKDKCIEIADEKALEESDKEGGEATDTDLEDDGLGASVRDNTEVPKTSKKVDISKASSVTIDDDDFADLDDDDVIDDLDDDEKKNEAEIKEAEKAEEEARKRFEEINKIISTKIKPTKTELDINSFEISSQPININTSLEYSTAAKENTLPTATAPLFATGRNITMSGLTGSELAQFVNNISNISSSNQAIKDTYALLYKHDVSENKPSGYVNWLRSIASADLIHMYFALYKATFSGSNYISFDCPECETFFMTDDIPMDKMWEVNEKASDEDKKRLDDIIKHGEVDGGMDTFSEKLIVISDNYAVKLRPLTIFSDIEDTYITDEFRTKYIAIIRISQFIKNLYYIDRERGILKPVDFKPDSSSVAKTIKRKVQVVGKFINSLNSDQFSILNHHIFDLETKVNGTDDVITYFIPEQECLGTFKKGDYAGQECTHKFEKQIMHPLNMLFTRHQLGLRSI